MEGQQVNGGKIPGSNGGAQVLHAVPISVEREAFMNRLYIWPHAGGEWSTTARRIGRINHDSAKSLDTVSRKTALPSN